MTTKVICADRLIDGTGNAPLPNPVVVVSGTRSAGVSRATAPRARCRPMPRISITRQHPAARASSTPTCTWTFPGNGTLLEDVGREPDGVLALRPPSPRAALAAGITTVRDNGARRTRRSTSGALSPSGMARGHGSC